MAGKDWMTSDIKRLRALYASGSVMDDIVKAFPGRTRKAVQEKAYTLGITLNGKRRCRFGDAQDKVILAELRDSRGTGRRASWVAVGKKIGIERAKAQARAYRLIQKGVV